MSKVETLVYKCDRCGYENRWTRDQIVQRGEAVVFRGEESLYSLPCQNPSSPLCGARRRVALPREARP